MRLTEQDALFGVVPGVGIKSTEGFLFPSLTVSSYGLKLHFGFNLMCNIGHRYCL